MNVYKCVYNNVVDFNNAINSYWPQSENPVTEDADNITGKDDLSILPPEILTEMMKYLPLKSVQALSLTNHKIKPITEPIIKFRTNLKTQEFFETFASKCKTKKYIFKPGMLEIFKEAVGSDNRVQIVSNTICSLYQNGLKSFYEGYICLETLLSPYNTKGIFTDKSLVKELMKNLNNGQTFIYYCDKINDKRFNHNKINSEILFLSLLTTNQIHWKDLNIEIFNVTSVPKELIEALVEALRENESINTVTISWQDCDLVQLDAILETIKNNERILEFRIGDQGFKRRSWGKSTKEKSYKEFEDLIKNKLSPTFQIKESDDYGFFRCQKLPV